MSQGRPAFKDVKKTSSLTTHKGYDYTYSKYIIGQGSFGKVFLGWTKDGKDEVAVKVIDRNCLKQDPKLKENLEREIKILKLLRGHEYVVQILDAKEPSKDNVIIITMELCDYDLDNLIKQSPFGQEEVVQFLYQLAEGMKALRKQNIVHRDLKPGNILIREDPGRSRKRVFKLADFGFARHFKDDHDKNVMMKSLAGTPVYMAPEALSCVFYKGKHYDDKVDIWSIGALLYKVIVGDCGFYANLEKILDYLKHKGDAIAFEYTKRELRYVRELPNSVNERLDEPFRQHMNELLRKMLKFDPRERMSFQKFFEAVDDIIRKKIEVINVLHGTSFKIIAEDAKGADILVEKVNARWQLHSEEQIIFSTACPHFIASYKTLSTSEFEELLERAGGSHGHAKLYVLPIQQLKETDCNPDTSCFEPLRFAIENGQLIKLMTEQKFCDEIIYMIDSLKLQQKMQLKGLEKLVQFTTSEIGQSEECSKLIEDVHQTLARVSLTAEWVQKELTIFDRTDSRLYVLLTQLEERKVEVQQLATELKTRFIPTLGKTFSLKDYEKRLLDVTHKAKGLSKLQRDAIVGTCQEIYDECVKIIHESTEKIKLQLIPFIEALRGMQSLHEKSAHILNVTELLSEVMKERELMLMLAANNKGTSVPLPDNIGDAALPRPDDAARGDGPLSPTNQSTLENIIKGLKRELQTVKRELANEKVTTRELKRQLNEATSKQRLRQEKDEVPMEEKTLEVASVDQVALAVSESDSQVFEDLTKQLKIFCSQAQRITFPAMPGAGLFSPDLTGMEEDLNTQQLLTMAQTLAETLRSSIPSLQGGDLVKFGNPEDYKEGDVAIFTQLETKGPRPVTVIAILHLGWPKPYMLLAVKCYKLLKINPRKIPDFFFARLSEPPRKMKLEEHRPTAETVGEKTGDFYRVGANPVDLKFCNDFSLLRRHHHAPSPTKPKRGL